MLLLIDIGNTRIKWAVADAGSPLGEWSRCGASDHDALAELAEVWRSLPLEHVIAANVAGAKMQGALSAALARPVEWFVSTASVAGLRNAYDEPASLGCDRLAAALGAYALYPGCAMIVAGCGTATTVDAITANGVFEGGMILPGLRLMAASLAGNTAQLPLVDADRRSASRFAGNTADAIAAGCLNAQAGAIERACAAFADRHGDVLCLVTGGAADAVAAQLSVPHQRIDHLVLIGLQAYAALSIMQGFCGTGSRCRVADESLSC